MPLGKFDRKTAEKIENCFFSEIEIENLQKEGASFFELTDFMDLCNNMEIDFNYYWITYVKTK